MSDVSPLAYLDEQLAAEIALLHEFDKRRWDMLSRMRWLIQSLPTTGRSQ